MSVARDEWCVVCGGNRLRHETKTTEFEVRGEVLTVDVPVRVCDDCGTTEEEPGVDPAAIAFAKYRKRKGLLTPDEIKAIRSKYQLSQRSLATLLGMSEATINRYEGGGLQDNTHDEMLRACRSPDVMADLLDRHGERLSPRQRQKALDALTGVVNERRGITPKPSKTAKAKDASVMNGFRRFEYARYAAAVVWFCRRLKTVTPTSLNKLLFYADFLCFRSETVSLTGSSYRRLPYGPVPADYNRLRGQLEMDQFVAVREVEWSNRHVGEEYSLGPKADELGTPFSTRELTILETVAKTFEGFSPSEISERSHEEPAWKETGDRDLMSYEKASDLSVFAP